MPLRYQNISIPLAKGINTKFDPKIVSLDSNLGSENSRVEDGTNKKRFGYENLSEQIESLPETNFSALGKLRDESLVFSESTAYTYSPALNQLTAKGSVVGVDVERFDVQVESDDTDSIDVAYGSGVLGVCYFKNGTGTANQILSVSVIDQNESAEIARVQITDTATAFCKIVALPGQFVVFYKKSSGNQLFSKNILFNNPTVATSEVTVLSNASQYFDAAFRVNAEIFVVAHDAAGGDTEYGYYNPNSGTFSGASVAIDSNLGVYVDYDSASDQFAILALGDSITSGNDRGAVYTIYDGALTQILSATDVIGFDHNNPVRGSVEWYGAQQIAILIERDNSTLYFEGSDFTLANDELVLDNWSAYPGEEFNFDGAGTAPTGLSKGTDYFVQPDTDNAHLHFYSTQAAALNDPAIASPIGLSGTPSGNLTLTQQGDVNTNLIFKYTATVGGTVTARGANGIVQGLHLGSRAYISGDNMYFVCDWDSPLQATSFVLFSKIEENTASAVSKCNYDVGRGEVVSSSILSNAAEISAGQWAVANSFRQRVEASNGDFLFTTSANYHVFNLNTANRFFNSEINKGTIIGGGLVAHYDGSTVTELNFNQFPEFVTFVADNSSGNLAAGDYGFQVVYEYVDKQGNFHRSAPSLVQTVTTSGGSSQVNFSIQHLRLTNKSFDRIKAVIYMTQVNGALYYRVADFNLIDGASVVYQPASSTIDTQPAGTEELIYTTGGVVENTAPPPSRIVATSKNRAFLVNSENKQEVWYSKSTVTGEGTGFNSIFRRLVSQTSDDVTAVETMDDKVVLWKPSEVYFFAGNGPNLLGVNDTFTETQLITNQVGSDNPDSVTFMKDGCTFQSGEKGLWLLGRDLSVSYFGAAVEEFNSERITAANNIRSANEVRFTTESGTQLVYDYLNQQWITDTNIQAKDAIVVNNRYFYLGMDSNLRRESTSNFTDDGSLAIPMSVTTPWIRLNGLQGFQRVRRAIFLGEFKSDHVLKIEIAYDYENFFRETKFWNAGAILDIDEFGDDAEFGDSETFGGDSDDVYQVRLHMPRQKCEAVKFRITDITDATVGESMQLTSMDLEVGVKKGLNKLQSNKSI